MWKDEGADTWNFFSGGKDNSFLMGIIFAGTSATSSFATCLDGTFTKRTSKTNGNAFNLKDVSVIVNDKLNITSASARTIHVCIVDNTGQQKVFVSEYYDAEPNVTIRIDGFTNNYDYIVYIAIQ